MLKRVLLYENLYNKKISPYFCDHYVICDCSNHSFNADSTFLIPQTVIATMGLHAALVLFYFLFCFNYYLLLSVERVRLIT